eukprot:6806525-Prymnesium_polylepis.1
MSISIRFFFGLTGGGCVSGSVTRGAGPRFQRLLTTCKTLRSAVVAASAVSVDTSAAAFETANTLVTA